MSRLKRLRQEAERQAAAWMWVDGTAVVYRRDDGTGFATFTRSAAAVMGDTAVIWLDGVSGCVALERVTPVLGAAPRGVPQ